MVTLVGGIMADEVQVLADDMWTAIQAVPESPMVHILIDAREAAIADKIWNYGKLRLRRHTRVYLVIVIGDSRLSGLIIAIFSKLINLPIHYRESVDDALRIISGRDGIVAEYLKD
jgi:hypothetical protein